MRPLLIVVAVLVAGGIVYFVSTGPEPDPNAVDEAVIAEQAAAEARTEIEGLEIDGAELGSDARGDLVDVVTTVDGGIEIGVTDAVLFSRLSQATRDRVADEMEAETADQEGLGGAIARAVTGAVAEGLATTVSIPLADIADIRYEDGRVVIEMADGGAPPFADATTNDRPLLESFDAEAGQRLADAFDKATRP